MEAKICTATIKMNTSEVLKVINVLEMFTDEETSKGILENKDFKGYEKLLNDFHLMYSSMTDMENQGLRE